MTAWRCANMRTRSGTHEEEVDEAAAETRERDLVRHPVEEVAFPDEVLVPPGRERPLLLHVHEARLGLPRLDEGDPRQPHAELLHADHDARPRAHRRGPLDDAHLLVRGGQALEDAGIAVKVPDGALRNAGKVQGEFERRHASSTPQNERSI